MGQEWLDIQYVADAYTVNGVKIISEDNCCWCKQMPLTDQIHSPPIPSYLLIYINAGYKCLSKNSFRIVLISKS